MRLSYLAYPDYFGHIDIFYKSTWNMSFIKIRVTNFLSDSSCLVGSCPISEAGMISKLVQIQVYYIDPSKYY